jgi:phosphatidylserine/phosphatidylglycerophosphate/cardiolipin synthase-like enzyme
MPMLLSLLQRAKKSGGQCYCAIYELTDPDLLKLLKGNKAVHLILSNTGPDNATNKQSRKILHQSGVDIHDRMLGGDHIGHNKFAVYVDKDEFAAWHTELLKAGFAIIHDKIVVVDPFSPDCVVITGSHNLDYKASYSNDENLLIIRGNQAQAYAVHVLDVYDHYRFRYVQQQQGKAGAFSGFLSTDSGWQKPYFTAAGQAEMQNWIAP